MAEEVYLLGVTRENSCIPPLKLTVTGSNALNVILKFNLSYPKQIKDRFGP
jgi:hypothetical protein